MRKTFLHICNILLFLTIFISCARNENHPENIIAGNYTIQKFIHAIAENRRGGSAPRYGHPQKVQAGQEAPRAAHYRQRAVLENAPLGADGKGGGGRQQLPNSVLLR